MIERECLFKASNRIRDFAFASEHRVKVVVRLDVVRLERQQSPDQVNRYSSQNTIYHRLMPNISIFGITSEASSSWVHTDECS
jgi:hypothetical protein